MKHKSHLEQDWMRHAGSVIAFSKLSTNQITPQRNFCPRPNMHSKSQNHSRCCGRRSKELAFKRRWWSLCERVGTEVWLDLREAERQQSLSQLSVYSGTWVFIRLLMIRFVSTIPSFASCFCFFLLLVMMQLFNHITPCESRTSHRYRNLQLCAHSPVRRFEWRWQITQHVSHYSLTFTFCQFSLYKDTNCSSWTVKLFWSSLSMSTTLLVSFTWSLILREANRARWHPLHPYPTVF